MPPSAFARARFALARSFAPPQGKMHGNRQNSRGEDGRAGPLLAVLDLGTNNCRLLIATQAARGGFRVVDSFSRIVRLGEGVSQSGLLSDAALDRTIAALKICSERIAKHGVARVRVIATQAARLAANADTLVRRARDEAGLDLKVISAEEEADLAAEGCAPLIGRRYRGALVFDIGGGSTEIIWLQKSQLQAPQKKLTASVPLGVVSLAENYGADASSRFRLRPHVHRSARPPGAVRASHGRGIRQPQIPSAGHLGHGHHAWRPSRSSCRATTATGWMAAGTRPPIC